MSVRPGRRAARGETGITLVELLTTIMILGIVLATIYSGLLSGQDTVMGVNERLRNLDEARVLVNVVTKDVRTAVRLTSGSSPFITADRNEAVFYANLDTTGAPKKVRIYVDGEDQLLEQVWDPDVGSVAPDYTYTGSPSVRFVGQYVANETTPVFTYLDDDDNPLTATPLSATDRLAIKAVRVTLEIKRTSSYNDATTTVVNRVRLPNLDYNAVAG